MDLLFLLKVFWVDKVSWRNIIYCLRPILFFSRLHDFHPIKAWYNILLKKFDTFSYFMLNCIAVPTWFAFSWCSSSNGSLYIWFKCAVLITLLITYFFHIVNSLKFRTFFNLSIVVEYYLMSWDSCFEHFQSGLWIEKSLIAYDWIKLKPMMTYPPLNFGTKGFSRLPKRGSGLRG